MRISTLARVIEDRCIANYAVAKPRVISSAITSKQATLKATATSANWLATKLTTLSAKCA